MGFPNIPSPLWTPRPVRHLHGPDDHALLFRYGRILRDRDRVDQSAGVPVHDACVQDDPRNGPIYPSYIPKTDSDGNDIAGVRLPDLTVRLRPTPAGVALGAWANDGCERPASSSVRED